MGNWLRSFYPWQNRRDTNTYLIPTTREEGSSTDPDRDPPLSNNLTKNEGATTHPDNAHGTTCVPSPISEDYDNVHSSPTANNPPCQESDFTHPSSDSTHSSQTCHSENNAQTLMTSTSAKPGRPIATDITSRGIEIQWTKPELSAENVIAYTIFYRCASDPYDQWIEQKASGTKERATVSGLIGNSDHYFKVLLEYEDGVKTESDISEPITTLESITLKNVMDRAWNARDKWYWIGLQLGLEASDLDIINTNNNEKPEDCFREMIKKWLNQKGGSWKKLTNALKHKTVGSRELAQSIAADLGLYATSKNPDLGLYATSENPDHDEFKSHLELLYGGLTPTKSSTNTWPQSPTRKVFNLAMIKSKEVQRGKIQDEFIRLTITGKIDDILREKSPVELKDIFQEKEQEANEKEIKRKILLLEGAPGCGKSTLSVHISQQWGQGKLFTEFKYVILVQLRDPAVQAASCIADLLPAKNDEMREQANKDIIACYGDGVLFVLDGWDELPSNLRKNSIFHELIQSGSLLNSPLLKSTIIVTSRPIASSDLHHFASTRIEILGFTPKELENYFTECLNNDSETVETLFERIHENPEIASSCYLPMNASILVHLFINDNNTLPTTQYGIFSELVLSCIYRHHNERTQLMNLTLESLQHIPEAIKEPFLFLCELAYHGIMNDKVVFSKVDDDTKVIFSKLPGDINTLGLLQGVESFVKRGKAISFNFLHLPIQEILAAFYISTQLSDDEQVTKFNELFDKPRFSAVFQFYAAITKLQTCGIKDVVMGVAKRSSNKTLLLSLLHCLYEAQDSSLCESVAQQLQHGLNFMNITLTLSDCLCIGYFLSCTCKVAAGKYKVNLRTCSIYNQGCKYLVSCYKSLDTHSAVTAKSFVEELSTNTHLEELNISDNPLGDDGLQHLAHALSINNGLQLKILNLQRCNLNSLSEGFAEAIKQLEDLNISYNALSCDGVQRLAQALRDNKVLKKLNVQRCSLSTLSKSFANALTANKCLEELDISDNALGDDSIQLLAHALRVNKTLKKLHLLFSCITLSGAIKLAEALADNKCLEKLNIHCSVYRKLMSDDKSVIEKIFKCLQNNYTLTELHLRVHGNLESSTIESNIESTVNEIRKSRGIPLLEVICISSFTFRTNIMPVKSIADSKLLPI